ncbi:MAG: glycosyltransferase [Sarcina sp.]
MMKKILFVPWTISGGGGSEHILQVLINQLYKEKSLEIDVLEIEKGKHKIEGINIKSIFKHNCLDKNIFDKVKRNIKLKMLILCPTLMARKYIEKNYDVVVSFNYLYPTFLISKLNSKKIFWVHGSISNLNYKKFSGVKRIQTQFMNFLQKRAMQKADVIVGISNKTCESILEVYPEVKPKLKKIYNGYNFDNIKGKSCVSCNQSSDLIYVGRLDKNKNVLSLVKNVESLLKTKKNLVFNIIGEGPEKKSIESYIQEKNLMENIKLLGYKENPYKYMKSSKILLLGSKFEGFPTVLIESLYLQLPFISTQVGGVQEISNQGEYGVIVDLDTQFEKKILEVLENYDIYKEKAIKGGEYIFKFSEENFVRSFLKEIER